MKKLTKKAAVMVIVIGIMTSLIACRREKEEIVLEPAVLKEALTIEANIEVYIDELKLSIEDEELLTAKEIELPEIEFAFELTPILGEALDEEEVESLDVPMPIENIVGIPAEKLIEALDDRTVYFDEIEFTEPGFFTYQVTQIMLEMDENTEDDALEDEDQSDWIIDDSVSNITEDEGQGDWIVDDSVFNITVAVSMDEENEALIAAVEITNEEGEEVSEMVFVNVYEPYVVAEVDDLEDYIAEVVEPNLESEATPAPAPASSAIPEDNATTLSSGEAMSYLALVNRNFRLSSSFSPSDLSAVNVNSVHGQHLMRSTAARAAENLFQAAHDEGGHTLVATSGYRSHATQASTHNHWISTMGEEEARRVSARPGHSEHQLGLALDITTHALGGQLSQQFSSTPEGLWVRNNAHKFGFIIRYPQGREADTGFIYEPWHIRFVGVDAATTIHNSGMILEEFLR